jgi:type I restriction enzyme M protein
MGEVESSKGKGTSHFQLSTSDFTDRTAQSFCVPKADIAAQGYDLSLNRYKEVVHEEVEHKPPLEILAELSRLETEIQKGMKELEGMLRSGK